MRSKPPPNHQAGSAEPEGRRHCAPGGAERLRDHRDGLSFGLCDAQPSLGLALGGRTYDLVEGTPLAASVADSNTVAASLSRLPDRADTNNAAADWGLSTAPTPGAANRAA